jgi:hypothetical protein
LSEASAKVLQRSLMKDPGQRFGSCAEFLGALAIALSEAPAPIAVAESASEEEVASMGPAPEPQHSAPIISIPDETPYELPTRVRRRRDEDDLESDDRRPRSSGGKKLTVILAMCFAIGATIVFIVLSNSGPTVPVQVLDTKSGAVSPPPEGMEVTSGAKRSAAQNTGSHSLATAAELRRRQELAPGKPAGGSSVSNPASDSDVELLTEPPGAKMIVDGRSDLACNSPCTLSLASGRHTVTAELAGYNLGRRIFNVPNEESLFVNLGKNMGVVVVTSAVIGCTVLVDGRPSGSTPATLHLTAGPHRVAVVGRTSRHEETVQVQTDGFDVERFLCQ